MYKFGKNSQANLATVDPRLQRVLGRAIKFMNFSVICGHRGEEEQNKLYAEGKTKARWGESKHNQMPSKAVDIVPYPVDWNDRARFALLAGLVIGIGAEQGLTIRWGGDWDRDFYMADNNFDDLPHFELVEN